MACKKYLNIVKLFVSSNPINLINEKSKAFKQHSTISLLSDLSFGFLVGLSPSKYEPEISCRSVFCFYKLSVDSPLIGDSFNSFKSESEETTLAKNLLHSKNKSTLVLNSTLLLFKAIL